MIYGPLIEALPAVLAKYEPWFVPVVVVVVLAGPTLALLDRILLGKS